MVLLREYDADHGFAVYDITTDVDATSTTQCEENDIVGGRGSRARSNRQSLDLINRLEGLG